MTFSEGTKEQLEKQWADLEADKQEALARIRAKKNKQHNNEREPGMTQKDKLTTVADLKRWLHDYEIHDDTQVTVEAPLKDVDGYVVNVTNIDYDHTSEALILQPMWNLIPDYKVAIRENALVKKIETLETALMEIASWEHHADECPEWYKDQTFEGIHEDDPDCARLLAWDETEWHEAWRDDHGYEDHEHLEWVVDKARKALTTSLQAEDSVEYTYLDDHGEYQTCTNSKDLPFCKNFDFKNLHDDYVGSVAWFGEYYWYYRTNDVHGNRYTKPEYMTFSEWDDAVAWVDYEGKCATHMNLGEKADVHHVRTLPDVPLAKNTGDPLGGKINIRNID